MRLIGFILAASVVLALLQAAVKLVVLLLIGTALVAFIQRPIETIGCFGAVVMIGLIARFPILAAVLIAALAIVRWLESDS